MSKEKRDLLQTVTLGVARITESYSILQGSDSVASGMIEAVETHRFNVSSPVIVLATEGQCDQYSGDQAFYDHSLLFLAVGFPIIITGIGLRVARRTGWTKRFTAVPQNDATIIRSNAVTP